MNSHILSYLDRFIEYNDPQFAVMITGEWGSGKTHFIKRWKEDVELLRSKKYKPLYVSLYGLHSIVELRENLNRQLHPFLTSAFVKTSKKFVGGLSKALIKCDLIDDKNPVEFSYELDLLPLLQSDNKEIQNSGKIIIFDDIERCHINRVELLGFINYFVEHCSCKVIVLCNEKKMLVPSVEKVICRAPISNVQERWVINNSEDIQDREYKEFKEKTIGTTFEVKPDIESAVEAFINNVASDPRNLLSDMKPYLSQMLEKNNNTNLRVLRQCILDFSSVVKQIPEDLYTKPTYVPVMRKFLLDLLITSLEVKACNPLFDNVDSLVYSFLPGDKKNSLASLIEHYSSVPQKLNIQILDYDSIKTVLIFIHKGTTPLRVLTSHLRKDEVVQQPWDNLTYYWKLSNEDFSKYYELTKKELRTRKIRNLDDLFKIAYRLVSLDRVDVMPVGRFFYNDVLACFNKQLESISSLDDLMIFKRDVYTRLNYYSFEKEVPLWKKIINAFLSAIENRVPKYKSRMTIAIENIKEDNLLELSKLLESLNPITRRDYTSSPMFDTPDFRKVAQGILGLSNEGRDLFRDILAFHYHDLDVSNYNEHKFYEGECENVKKIVEILKKRRLKKIDKYSVSLIIKQFEKLINNN